MLQSSRTFSSCKAETLYPLNNRFPSFLPPAPANHHSILSLWTWYATLLVSEIIQCLSFWLISLNIMSSKVHPRWRDCVRISFLFRQGYSIVYTQWVLFIHSSAGDTWVASAFLALWIILQGTRRCDYAFGTLLSVLWGRYARKWNWNQSHQTIFYSGYIIFLPSHQQRTRGPISAHSHQNLLLLGFFRVNICYFFNVWSYLLLLGHLVFDWSQTGQQELSETIALSLGNLFQVFSLTFFYSLGPKI